MISSKAIFAELIENAQPQSKNIMTSLYSICGFTHIITAVKGKSLSEINAFMIALFKGAALTLGCSPDEITLVGDSREGTHFQLSRLETLDEMIKRVQGEAEYEANRRRRAKQEAATEAKTLKKRIAAVEAELAKLTNLCKPN